MFQYVANSDSETDTGGSDEMLSFVKTFDQYIPSQQVFVDRLYIYTLTCMDEDTLASHFLYEGCSMRYCLHTYRYNSLEDYVVKNKDVLSFLSIYVNKDRQGKLIKYYFNEAGYKVLRNLQLGEGGFGKSSVSRPNNMVRYPLPDLPLISERFTTSFLLGRIALMKAVIPIYDKCSRINRITVHELDKLVAHIKEPKFQSFSAFVKHHFPATGKPFSVFESICSDEFYYNTKKMELTVLVDPDVFREQIFRSVSKRNHLLNLLDAEFRKLRGVPWKHDESSFEKINRIKKTPRPIQPLIRGKVDSDTSCDESDEPSERELHYPKQQVSTAARKPLTPIAVDPIDFDEPRAFVDIDPDVEDEPSVAWNHKSPPVKPLMMHDDDYTDGLDPDFRVQYECPIHEDAFLVESF